MFRGLSQCGFGIEAATGEHRAPKSDGQDQHAETQSVKHRHWHRNSRSDPKPRAIQDRRSNAQCHPDLRLDAAHLSVHPVVPEVSRHDSTGPRHSLGRESPSRISRHPPDRPRLTPARHARSSELAVTDRPSDSCELSAAANDSARKSVLSMTTSAPTIAAAKTAVTKPRPLRHKTPTACPGLAPRRCSSSARLSVHKTQFAIADRALVVDHRCPIRPAGGAHPQQSDKIRAPAGDLATKAEQRRRPRRHQQPRAHQAPAHPVATKLSVIGRPLGPRPNAERAAATTLASRAPPASAGAPWSLRPAITTTARLFAAAR